MIDRERLEAQLAGLPLLQYAFLDTNCLQFSENVRHICQSECPMYGKSWSCPPAVGTVAECKARCQAYPEFLMIVTMAEVDDIANLEQTLATRPEHEAITRQVQGFLTEQGLETYVLSTEACALCESCAYPDGLCRHPERMYPCLESHGIVATALAEEQGVDFIQGNIVTWFSLLFYR